MQDYTELNEQQANDISRVNSTVIVAHRGASRRYTENSMAAVKEVLNMALVYRHTNFFIEADIHRCKSGELVLMHDSSVARTTYGSGEITEKTLDEIRALKMRPVTELLPALKVDPHPETGAGYREGHLLPITDADLRIPTLDEVVEVMQEANIRRISMGSTPVGLAIDMKVPKLSSYLNDAYNATVTGAIYPLLAKMGMTSVIEAIHPPSDMAEPLADMLNAAGRALIAEQREEGTPISVTPMLLLSQGPAGYRDLRVTWELLEPEVRARYEQGGMVGMQALTALFPASAEEFRERMQDHTPAVIGYNYSWEKNSVRSALNAVLYSLSPLNGDNTREAIESGFLTNFWTVNNPDRMRELVASGAHFITTDSPAIAMGVMQELTDHIREYGSVSGGVTEHPHVRFGMKDIIRERQPKAIFCDAWGVLHDGHELYPHTIPTLERLKEQEVDVIIVSNTPARAEDAAAKMEKLGLPRHLYKGIVTAGEVAYQHLEELSKHLVESGEKERYFLIGEERHDMLRNMPGFTRTTNPQEADMVITASFSKEHPDLAALKDLLEGFAAKGTPMMCLNPDSITIKSNGQVEHQGGAIGIAYMQMEGAGEVSFFGKPYYEIYDAALKIAGVPRQDVLAVGDSPTHDIMGANAAGITSVLVYGTGILGMKETEQYRNRRPSASNLQAMCREEESAIDGNPVPQEAVMSFSWERSLHVRPPARGQAHGRS